MEIINLKCDYLENPLGIDNINPRLSWILKSEQHGQCQTAYQILVASSNKLLAADNADLWDSGKVESEQTNNIKYSGKKLPPRQECFWKVRVWDKNEKISNFSKINSWEMGLLDSLDYRDKNRPTLSAKWIGSPEIQTPMFRKKFSAKNNVKRARAYICGLGYYELFLNGEKVGDHVLDPAQTDYEQRSFYVVYDIKEQLKANDNVIGIILGNGWYNQNIVWGEGFSYGNPGVICQLEIDYDNGETQIICSDGTFKVAQSPILNNNVYAGEEYDARLEIENWLGVDFDDGKWQNAKWISECSPLLISQNLPAIKKINTIKPVNLTQPKPGIFVYDLGQNFSGWAKIMVTAPKGTIITLKFAEKLFDNGMIDPATTGPAATKVIQTDVYICKGKGEEIWEPRFTYHGFRYVEMTGLPTEPSLNNLEGIVVHTAVKPSGKFNCSDEMINKIHKTALWTELTNLHGIPTDCPHRERCGWLGDALISAEMTIYNFDMALFWSKFIEDINTTRRGKLPQNIAPGKRLCGAKPDWQMAYILVPWFLYLYYGDIQILERNYDGMTQLMNYLKNISKNHIVPNGFGDWCAPSNIIFSEKTDPLITTTAFYYYSSKIMSRISKLLDDKNQNYDKLSLEIKSAFIKKFYDEKNKSFGTQCADSMALKFNLIPDGSAQSIADSLIRDVMGKYNCHFSTGIFGIRYLYDILTDYGYDKEAVQLINQTTAPSLGHIFSLGATTFWEHLPSNNEKAKLYRASLNHPMQGGFAAWFYQGIGGIEADPENPGFKHFFLRPQLTKELEFAEVEFNSIRGLISSKWKNVNGRFHWHINIPVNSSATVYFPAENFEEIFIDGKLITERSDIKIIEKTGKRCAFKLYSGEYSFERNVN
ncbi:MAG: alpha-L-rhamnosidase [Chlamydiae bacterium]|nr:MAG: alpha-L-rhamnosidase [Chlamydiota bacterium]